MWNSAFVLLCLFVIGAFCMFDQSIGKGKWKVNSVMKCPDSDQYPMHIDVKRRKMNRTHDGFTVKVDLPEPVTDTSHGVYADVCKKVDGGCKSQYVVDEDSMCALFEKYGKDNFEKGLVLAGVDPPTCPIPAGYFEMEDMPLNYDDFPEQGMFGDFLVSLHLTKNKTKLSCIMCDVTFGSID